MNPYKERGHYVNGKWRAPKTTSNPLQGFSVQQGFALGDAIILILRKQEGKTDAADAT